jgi:hypothetical protein
MLKKMILLYLIGIFSQLKSIHVGANLFVQLKATIKLGLLISPFVYIIEKLSKWGFDNSDYIITVLVAIAVDHALGSYKHAYIDKDFTWKLNLKGLMTKISLVVACGFLFEGLQVIIHKQSIITEYLTITTRLIVFLYPAGSAFGNSSVISGGKFPPDAWMKRINKFQTNLNPKDITEEEKKDQENQNEIQNP